MNLREYCILEVLNIASTKYSEYSPSILRPLQPLLYQATAAEVRIVLLEDDRFEVERLIIGDLTVRQIGATLGRLARYRANRIRSEPLVERPKDCTRDKWALTKAGVAILSA